MDQQQPPRAVLDAFGARGEPVLLAGGKGGTWRAGDVVVKPAEGDDEVRWRSDVLEKLPESPAFRIARPIRAAGGDWLADGWEAARAVAGHPDQRRVDEVVRTGIAFHEVVAAVPRPSFLDTRSDPWSYGDSLAWEETPPRRSGKPSALLGELLAARRPVRLNEQIVHGDLLGNVLFAEGLPPAVIDWAAYWRPAPWASAVAVVDAMVWHGEDETAITRWADQPAWGQLLVRAAIYRLATWSAAGWSEEPEDAYRPAVRSVLNFVVRQV